MTVLLPGNAIDSCPIEGEAWQVLGDMHGWSATRFDLLPSPLMGEGSIARIAEMLVQRQ